MQLSLLVTEQMEPVPEEIRVLEDWGSVSVKYSEGVDTGTHMMLEAEASDFIAWLSPFDGVWITTPGTSPIQQQFTVVHVRPELCGA